MAQKPVAKQKAVSSGSTIADTDDAPLSSLITKGGKKYDDDTPLSALVVKKAAPKAQGSSAAPKAADAAAAAKAAGKGRGKARSSTAASAGAKRKASDSDSSSSSSDSDSSSSSSDSQVKRQAAKGAKRKLLRKNKPASGGQGTGTEAEAEDDYGGGEEYVSRKKDRTLKESVAVELLCRWWYALPDWPPSDNAYYEAELKKRGCRCVSLDDWEWVPEEDSDGLRKVYALSQFRGCFRCHSGELIDCRPKDTCPCYNNFVAKSLKELYSLLIKAYENQIQELQKAEGPDTPLEGELKVKLNAHRKKMQEVREI
mmetsp:Transcript_63122/g.150487  ORF Transcript_63122/g.150487 Transcript_63122/m.150487 type:complete len:313 (-) Transcript_63122:143-1081(-)